MEALRFVPHPARGSGRGHDYATAHADTRFLPPLPLPEGTSAPTEAGGVAYGPELPSENTVYLALDLAVRIGEVQLSSGAGIAEVSATILGVTRAYGLPDCEVDVIFTSITICCHRGTELEPVTTTRVINTRGTDYTRLLATEGLLARITAGRTRIYDALSELTRISSAAHPYPRWAATVGWAGLSASVAVLLGGSPLAASIAAVISALVDRLGRVLNQRALPYFFQQLIGGTAATGIALALGSTGLFPDAAGLAPSLVIGAAITVLLSGLSIVSTVQDAITGYYVTAAGRTVEIALTSVGLIAGVVLALNVASTLFGLENKPNPPTAFGVLSLPLAMIAGAAAAGFFALASYATARTIAISCASGALAGLVDRALTVQGAQLSAVAAAGVAALAVGFAGGIVSRRLHLPPIIITLSGLTPLLPGLATYRALYALVVPPQQITGLIALIAAIATALALGAGAVFGDYLAHPVRTRLGRWQPRASRTRTAKRG